MVNPTPESFFLTALENRTEVVRKSLRNAVQSLLNHSPQNRTSALESFVRDMELLRDSLAPEQQPSWIARSLASGKRAVAHANSDNEQSFFELSTTLAPEILNHRWTFRDSGVDSGLGFDFDPIYHKHRTECKVPELFDALISAVEAILNDPAMDSRKAERELQRIIATLKKARGGASYVQTVLSLSFAGSFLKHLAKEYAEKTPLGPSIKAFSKALEEAQEAMESVSSKIQADVDSQLDLEVSRLPRPAWPRITMRDEVEGSE